MDDRRYASDRARDARYRSGNAAPRRPSGDARSYGARGTDRPSGDGRYRSANAAPRRTTGDARYYEARGTGRPTRPGSADPRRRPAPRGTGVARPARRRRGPSRLRVAAQGLARGIRRLKRDETSTILVNSALVALALVLVLAVLALFRTPINLARVRRLADAHSFEQAEALLERLAGEGLSDAKLTRSRLDLGERMLTAGEYDKAEALAEQLPEGEAALDLQRRARYAQAEALYAAGNYEAAAQAFYQMGDYGDSASRCDDARAALAIQAQLAGDTAGAHQLLMGLTDTYAHVSAAALAVGGSEAEAQRILAQEAFSPERLTEMERNVAALSTARASAQLSRVAAGDRHTLALRADGTVLACGDNAQGQCDVSGWTDVRQVAAGAQHSLGLRADGTVVACGDNSLGQCDVSGWTGITAIAANACGSFGLRADGTVAATEQYAALVDGWHDVTQIAAGSYAAGCLYGQGSMLCTHKGARLGLSSALDGLSVCGAVSAGVLADGTMVCSYAGAPAWMGLRQVHVMQTGLVGVTLDGRALLFPFRAAAETPLQLQGVPMEAAGTGTHIVVRTEDGRVYAYGSNDYGQCDVSQWQLN